MTFTFANVPDRFFTRWRPRVLAVVLAVTALLAGAATAAEAHDVLVRTSPTDGSIVAVAPAQVRLIFSQPPLAVGTVVIITGPAGRVQTGKAVLAGSAISQRLPPGSPAGRYTVAWRTTSTDGHPVSGTFSFSATSPSPVQRASATPSGTPSSRGTTTTLTPSTPASSPTSPAATSTPTGAAGNASALWWVVAGAAVLLLLLMGFILTRKTRSTPESERDPKS